MRVFLDTNIYISALVFRGEPRKVLTYAEARRFALYISPTIQIELERALKQIRVLAPTRHGCAQKVPAHHEDRHADNRV
jgi:predicted nucleic acid-binding protein